MAIYNSYVANPGLVHSRSPVLTGSNVVHTTGFVAPPAPVVVGSHIAPAPRLVASPTLVTRPVVAAPATPGNYFWTIIQTTMITFIPWGMWWFVGFWMLTAFQGEPQLNLGANPAGTSYTAYPSTTASTLAANPYAALTFTFLYTLGGAAGAIFGGYLVRTTGNPRGIFALGNLIFAVWIFVFWQFRVWLVTPVVAGDSSSPLNGDASQGGMARALGVEWFWILTWVGHCGSFAAVAAASGMIAYISKGYNMSNNPRTGTIWAFWFFQLVTLQFCAWLVPTLVASTGSLYWIMTGGLLTAVMGIVFMTQMPMAAPPQAYMEEAGIEAAISVNLRSIVLFIASAGIWAIGNNLGAQAVAAAGPGTLTSMLFWFGLGVTAFSSFFHGWLFDGVWHTDKGFAFNLWLAFAWFTSIFTLLNTLGNLTGDATGTTMDWRPVTTMLCNWTFLGGWTVVCAHMLFWSGNPGQEASTGAATMIFWHSANLVQMTLGNCIFNWQNVSQTTTDPTTGATTTAQVNAGGATTIWHWAFTQAVLALGTLFIFQRLPSFTMASGLAHAGTFLRRSGVYSTVPVQAF